MKIGKINQPLLAASTQDSSQVDALLWSFCKDSSCNSSVVFQSLVPTHRAAIDSFRREIS
jgi:hypothetical protein